MAEPLPYPIWFRNLCAVLAWMPCAADRGRVLHYFAARGNAWLDRTHVASLPQSPRLIRKLLVPYDHWADWPALAIQTEAGRFVTRLRGLLHG